MKTFGLAALALLAGATLSVPALGPALAAGDPPSDSTTCPKGQVFDQSKKSCVKAGAGLVDDKSLTDYAYLLAKQGRYAEALSTLDLLADPNTAVALNYRGYATRKSGRVEDGIAFYKQAVALDPNYTLVREYLGEAYLIQGRVDLAREQLAEIGRRCGATCEPYNDLADAIADARG